MKNAYVFTGFKPLFSVSLVGCAVSEFGSKIIPIRLDIQSKKKKIRLLLSIYTNVIKQNESYRIMSWKLQFIANVIHLDVVEKALLCLRNSQSV